MKIQSHTLIHFLQGLILCCLMITFLDAATTTADPATTDGSTGATETMMTGTATDSADTNTMADAPTTDLNTNTMADATGTGTMATNADSTDTTMAGSDDVTTMSDEASTAGPTMMSCYNCTDCSEAQTSSDTKCEGESIEKCFITFNSTTNMTSRGCYPSVDSVMYDTTLASLDCSTTQQIGDASDVCISCCTSDNCNEDAINSCSDVSDSADTTTTSTTEEDAGNMMLPGLVTLLLTCIASVIFV